MKKIAICIAVTIMSLLSVVMMPAQEAAAAADCDSHFLGLPAWYDGLTTPGSCDIKSPSGDAEVKAYVWTVVLNIISLIMGLIGYLAIGFVMWGGIQYMIAQGDPGKVAKGKKTITNAVIGLVLVMTASILSGTISGIVSGARTVGDSTKSSGKFFQEIFNKVFLWSGIVAVIMLIYGGIQYITSAGNTTGMAKAKTTILYSVIGLLVVIFAAAIVNVVVGAIPE